MLFSVLSAKLQTCNNPHRCAEPPERGHEARFAILPHRIVRQQFFGEGFLLNNYFCTNSGCTPCQQQPQPQRTGCACGEDFRRALELLCCDQLRLLVDFSAFAFVSDHYLLGSALTTVPDGTAPADNLAEPAGSYVCGSNSCEAVTVSGLLYAPDTAGTALAATVTQAALCRLNAVAFDALAVDGDAAANFQTISQTLSQLLRPHKPMECDSVIDALTGAAAVRTSTVAVGPLVVENSAILGQIGSILVMANSTDNRFYFICADKIDFIG